MYPELFSIGPLTIYSFGVMVVIAFFCGNWLIALELKRLGLEKRIRADSLTTAILLGGLLGAKANYILLNFGYFLDDPWSSLFSGGGLVWYGGFIGGLAAFSYVVLKRRLRWLQLADAVAPALALGYAIGRIGCLLSGDGDYGKPSDLPWAMAFPNGTVPTLVPVHPTPIYEALIMAGFCLILLKIARGNLRPGVVFCFYLVLAGTERFMIEFWRINPVVALGLTMAQFMSIASITVGACGLFLGRLKTERV